MRSFPAHSSAPFRPSSYAELTSSDFSTSKPTPHSELHPLQLLEPSSRSKVLARSYDDLARPNLSRAVKSCFTIESLLVCREDQLAWEGGER